MAGIDGITEWFSCDCCSHLISVTDLNTAPAGRGDWDLLESDVVARLVEMAERAFTLSDRFGHGFASETRTPGTRCDRCGLPQADPIHTSGSNPSAPP